MELPPPPRLTVYQTLNQVLDKYDKVDGPYVRSITITGHSLGGALASICGFDLATKIAEATGARKGDDSKNDPELDDDYKATREARKEFMAAIKRLRDNKVPVPKVAVVSFAAPRVGDTNYAKALGHRTLMSPWSVLEPCSSGIWNKVSVGFRDRFFQAIKMPWYWMALRQMREEYAQPRPDAFGRTPTAADSVAGAGGGNGAQAAAAQSGPGVGMLRLVNTHDIVTKLPAALLVPGFYYVHGGYELLFNSYAVSYFKKDWWGAEIGNSHNMEMYLHLLDSSRDKALVNKSADLLVEQEQIPGCWWDPIPHKGLTYSMHGGTARHRWYGSRKPVPGAVAPAAAGQQEQASIAAAVQREQPSTVTVNGATYSKMN